MTIPAEITQLYNSHRPYVAEAQKRVRDIVLSYAEPRGYAFAARAKDVISIAEKIETGRYRSWAQLDDLYACTIVIPTLEEEPAILAHLASSFDIVETRRRGSSTKDPLVFRFDATRVIARLGSASGVTDPDSSVAAVLFEVQIRTAFEHAWSTTTHKLAYKGDRIDWRRLRLAAQLKATVEQLDLLIAGYDSVSDLIEPQHWPEIMVKQKIESVFRASLDEKSIPSELAPQSWTRFCDNVYELFRKGFVGSMKKFPTEAELSLGIIQRHIDEDRDRFPTSISLFQYVLGVLSVEKRLPKSFERYYPLITDSLSTLYPSVMEIESRFLLAPGESGDG